MVRFTTSWAARAACSQRSRRVRGAAARLLSLGDTAEKVGIGHLVFRRQLYLPWGASGLKSARSVDGAAFHYEYIECMHNIKC